MNKYSKYNGLSKQESFELKYKYKLLYYEDLTPLVNKSGKYVVVQDGIDRYLHTKDKSFVFCYNKMNNKWFSERKDLFIKKIGVQLETLDDDSELLFGSKWELKHFKEESGLLTFSDLTSEGQLLLMFGFNSEDVVESSKLRRVNNGDNYYTHVPTGTQLVYNHISDEWRIDNGTV
jgi:hypothetical protein